MPPFLRPPGVRSEKDMKARCISCGRCVAVCTYACIEMTPDYIFSEAGRRKYSSAKIPVFFV
jgi:formate hydrogenlyase subunit 6/NADH:ubiquinone oxidoreductase subunit I